MTSRVDQVRQPIPICVLEVLHQFGESFRACAFLEPIFHKGRILRSISQVRRAKCRPKDPLVVGTLGVGPFSGSHRIQDRSSARAQGHPSGGEKMMMLPVIFLLGHWD